MMKEHNQVASRIILFICVITVLFTLSPFWFMVVSSFKSGEEMVRYGINLKIDPKVMSVKNYFLLVTERQGIYFRWYFNSVLITVIQTVLSVLLSSMVGHGLAVYRFKGKTVVFSLVMVVMMIPVEILLLPLYKLMIDIRLFNTYAGVILPFAVSPFAIFFFRQYIIGVPKDYLDAARIDGCKEFGIYARIMLPIILPAIGAMTILMAMNSWNAFIWPMVVAGATKMMTIPVGLATMITPYGNNYDMLMSGAMLAVIPVAVIFLLMQNTFINSLTIGGIKE
jgi:arabinosaccharide transport system permease protein